MNDNIENSVENVNGDFIELPNDVEIIGTIKFGWILLHSTGKINEKINK